MQHNEHTHSTNKQYTLKSFMPLIVIFGCITAFTLGRQLWAGWNLHEAMYDFMGSFFLVFGTFKLLKLRGFAEAYAMYDILAKQSTIYAHTYPFIEITLGIAYMWRLYPTLTNWITLILMLVSAIGVANELRQKKTIMCACLGTVFKVPMTYVTLAEDLLMAGMAAWMLFA